MKVTTAWLVVFLACLMATSCGYLDEDLLVDDATFEEGFGVGGLSMHGYSSSGCGGIGVYSRRMAMLDFGEMSIVGERSISGTASLSDAEILELTDIDVVDESEQPRVDVTPNAPERMYFSAMAKRDAALSRVY